METLIVQSYREDDVPPWIARCLASVRDWAESRGQGYRFVGDAILDRVPEWYREKAGHRWPVMTDLGRLELIAEALDEGWARAVWLDADVLVFDPAGFEVEVPEGYAFGREVWVQEDGRGRLKVYRNVHNAIAAFEAGNPFLDFYRHACERIVGRVEGGVPPQIVGPKFLTALHNMMGLPLIEAVGMASPPVVRDLARGGGPAWDLLRSESPGPIRALNLCSSLAGEAVDEAALLTACDRLGGGA